MYARRRRHRRNRIRWFVVLPVLVVVLVSSAKLLLHGISFGVPSVSQSPLATSGVTGGPEQSAAITLSPTPNVSSMPEGVAAATPAGEAPGVTLDAMAFLSSVGGGVEDERPVEPTPSATVVLTPTSTPPPRRIITYTVQAGDSVWSVASRFDLDIETLRWSNPALVRNPDVIWPDQVLTILPVRGAYHTVKAGETLEKIASAYGVDPAVIVAEPLNELEASGMLRAGQELVIPGGRKDISLPKPPLSPNYTFAWPLWGVISQGYHTGHHAIDIAGPYDTPVYAAASGRVLFSAFSTVGYGYMVKIDHGGGLVAIYGHLKGDYVAVGDWVQRGQMIGRLGSTGNSTGPHLHFEVRRNGVWVTPLSFLPPR